MNEQRYPLSWPPGWKRSSNRVSAAFGKTREQFRQDLGRSVYAGKQRLSIADAIERLAGELRRMGVREETVVISTNLRTNIQGIPRGDQGDPVDPGVAVYWERKGKKQCMAIDRYRRVSDNIGAIAATLEALRAIERHGGGEILERAFQGFAQLPAAIVNARPWREVLGFEQNGQLSVHEIETRFRELAHQHHPDHEGEEDRMRELIEARNQARQELSSVGAAP